MLIRILNHKTLKIVITDYWNSSVQIWKDRLCRATTLAQLLWPFPRPSPDSLSSVIEGIVYPVPQVFISQNFLYWFHFLLCGFTGYPLEDKQIPSFLGLGYVCLKIWSHLWSSLKANNVNGSLKMNVNSNKCYPLDPSGVIQTVDATWGWVSQKWVHQNARRAGTRKAEI